MTSTTQITSITNGTRQSNIEILRLLSMFLVLVVHATFFSTGIPTSEDFVISPIPSFTKIAIRSTAIVCVNIFILITGWFGIRPSFNGFSNFVFQCTFFLFAIYVYFLLTGLTTFSYRGLAACLCLTQDYWFVKAYIALYILSPILNLFIEKTSKKQYKTVLITFFAFQSIFGWIGSVSFIANGYSCFSFIGLYLLARYIKIYGCGGLSNWGGVSYIIAIIINTIAYYLCVKYNIKIGVYDYINPVVIVGSLGLFLKFERMQIKPNKFINWIAKSAFAVYLLHCNPNIMIPIFKRDILNIYESISGIECIIEIFGYLIIVYCIAILLDQLRRLCWKYISKYLNQNVKRFAYRF